MNDDIALTIAQRLIKAEEGCYLNAYPDPASPLARALGHAKCEAIGRGALDVPAEHTHLSGDPWTIGYGYTGSDIKAGAKWSQQHADYRLTARLLLDFERVKTTWPGAHRLHPKAQAALISLVYNRGANLTKKVNDPLDRRREMRLLQPAVVQRDYATMATLIRGMKRIWEGQGLAGLLKRRDAEADLCAEAFHDAKGG